MFTCTQAPTGGVTIDNIFYKGGQFLPSDNIPKRGKYNNSVSKNTKVRKLQIEAYKWIECKSQVLSSIYKLVADTVAKPDWENDKTKLVYCGDSQVLNYIGMTEQTAKTLINSYNLGARLVLTQSIK